MSWWMYPSYFEPIQHSRTRAVIRDPHNRTQPTSKLQFSSVIFSFRWLHFWLFFRKPLKLPSSHWNSIGIGSCTQTNPNSFTDYVLFVGNFRESWFCILYTYTWNRGCSKRQCEYVKSVFSQPESYFLHLFCFFFRGITVLTLYGARTHTLARTEVNIWLLGLRLPYLFVCVCAVTASICARMGLSIQVVQQPNY